MSTSDWPAHRTLEERVLVELAERMVGELDQVDVKRTPFVTVKSVMEGFTLPGPDAYRPIEVRCALSGLIQRGFVRHLGSKDPDLLRGASRVTVTANGLKEALTFRQSLGEVRSETRLVVPERGRAVQLKFDTGNKELDAKLNRSGTVLGCFYVLLVKNWLRVSSLTVAQLRDELERIAKFGVTRRAGPRTENLGSTGDGVIRAVAMLTSVLPVKLDRPGKRPRTESKKVKEADARKAIVRLTARFPVMDVVASADSPLRDWRSVQMAAWAMVMDDGSSQLTNVNRALQEAGTVRRRKPQPGVTADIAD